MYNKLLIDSCRKRGGLKLNMLKAVLKHVKWKGIYFEIIKLVSLTDSLKIQHVQGYVTTEGS